MQQVALSWLVLELTRSAFLAFLLGFLVASGRVHYWEVVSCAFLLGLLDAADMPARQSFIISLVDRRDLMNALSLHAALFNSARIVGPALARLIIGRWGLAACFF